MKKSAGNSTPSGTWCSWFSYCGIMQRVTKFPFLSLLGFCDQEPYPYSANITQVINKVSLRYPEGHVAHSQCT